MARLPLAVDIADAVADARRRHSPFDVKAKAKQLLEDHPEAGAAQSDIEETLLHESDHAGLSRLKPGTSRFKARRHLPL
jgi:hypothetical protein